MKKHWHVLSFLIFLSLSQLAFSVPPTEFMPPLGQYSVGCRTYESHDPRLNPFHFRASRELKITVYYPCEKNEKKTNLGQVSKQYWCDTYQQQHISLPVRFANQLLPDSWQFKDPDYEVFKQLLNQVYIYRENNAPFIKDTKFPVIYFFHGFGCFPDNYSMLIQELVSVGYVVIAVHHPGVTTYVQMDDGRMIPDQEYTDVGDIVLDDIKFFLNVVKRIPAIDQVADFNKVAVMGHNMGAFALHQLTIDEARMFKARIFLDEFMSVGNVLKTPSYYVFSQEADPKKLVSFKHFLRDTQETCIKFSQIADFPGSGFTDEWFMASILNRHDLDLDLLRKFQDLTSELITFLNIHLQANVN